MPWIDQSIISTNWNSSPEGTYSTYSTSGTYNGDELAPDHVDLTYNGGYFDQDLWNRSSDVETIWI